MDYESDSDFLIDFASIPKLNNDNYHLWSRDIMIQLRALGALEITLGTETAPAGEKAARRFRTRSGKAVALIHSTCSPSAKSWIMRAESPSEMWEALKARYHLANSNAGQMAVRIEFFRARLEPTDKSILDYITRLKDCCDRLEDTPSAIHDATLASQILYGLPASFSTIRTIIRYSSSPDTILPSKDVIEKLLRSEEMTRMSGKGVNSAIAPAATVANIGRGSRPFRGTRFHRGNRGSRTPVACSYCRKNGHYRSECRRMLGDQRANRGSPY